MFGSVCLVCVLALFAAVNQSALLEFDLPAANQKYNLLVDGFRSGALSLKADVPQGFSELADPYNPQANAPYRIGPDRLQDSSYYRGELYLYFGPAPALTLFWPWRVLTGHYLSHEAAVAIFCIVGFLASAGLLLGIWRRYFPGAGFGLVLALLPALALAPGALGVLQQPEVYEVAISCAYAFSMLALGALWLALERPVQRGRWLAAASLFYGLAVAARPSMAFGAVILLIPVILDWRSRTALGGLWRKSLLLGAAIGPIALIGLGLMVYNQMRFGSPLEFGTKYALQGVRAAEVQDFSIRYAPFNFRMYFFDREHWSRRFPFLRHSAPPPVPAGHDNWETSIAILTALPVSWLALAAVAGIRSGVSGSTRRWFLAILTALFGASALTVCLHRSTNERYELDFLPALLLLAAAGTLALDCILTRRLIRRAFYCAGGLLLIASLAFAVCNTVQSRIYQYLERGNYFATRNRLAEAAAQYEDALRLRPEFAEAHNNLALLLARQPGRQAEAIAQLESALRLGPGNAAAHHSLGLLFSRQPGKQADAIVQYQIALRLKPDYAEAHNDWAILLAGQPGRQADAIAHFEAALRLKPDYAEAHNNYANLLASQPGRQADAIAQYESALQLRPDYAEAHNNYANLLASQPGRQADAIAQYEAALRLRPDYVNAHYNLAVLLEKLPGRKVDAILHFAAALKINPDFAPAKEALQRLQPNDR